MRRERIYPHRAVRHTPIAVHAVVAATVFAVLTSVAVFVWREPIIAQHSRLSDLLLNTVGIPVRGVTSAEVFPSIGSAMAPDVPVFSVTDSPLRMFLMFTVSVLVLLWIHRRMELGRTFVEFLMVLVLAPAGAMLFAPSLQITSVEFALLWMRTEVLVWLFLPWLAAFLFIALQPAAVFAGALAGLALQVYAIVWSAVRLAFCLAVMHFSGGLFVPVLWFAVGLLADLIYVIAFHSVTVHWSAGKIWGRRIAWRF